MALERIVRIPVREKRGGTPNLQDVARRGEGGVRLLIEGGRWAMMTAADAALTETERASIVEARQRPTITEISVGSMSEVEKVATPLVAPLDLGLLFDSKSNMVAMAGEVTIGQMRLFVQETKYKATGHNAKKFNKLVKEGDASAPMVFTNEADCLAFILWALSKAQAQDPRIQTLGLPSDSQWESMRQTFRGQQSGEHWERLSDNYFRSFHFEDRSLNYLPENRWDTYAFRLVGTYQKS